MIVPISINLDDLQQFSLTREETEGIVDYTIKEITAKFAEQWEATAREELHQTRDRYISNLFVVDSGRMQGMVILDYSKDPLIKGLEEGLSSFDEKIGFENSPKKKVTKSGGWYLTIPFKIGTPDAIGEGSGFSFNMSSEVYPIIQSKPVDSQGKATLTLKEIPASQAIPQTRAAINAIPTSKAFEAYTHKTSVNQGIVKTVDSVTGQSSYNSFRRVSDKSDPNAFIHPGIPAKNLAELSLSKFETTLDTELSKIVDAALDNFGI